MGLYNTVGPFKLAVDFVLERKVFYRERLGRKGPYAAEGEYLGKDE